MPMKEFFDNVGLFFEVLFEMATLSKVSHSDDDGDSDGPDRGLWDESSSYYASEHSLDE
jgi:hypothetical protein